MLPTRVAAQAPVGTVIAPPGLPELEVWPGTEATVAVHLLAQRIAPVLTLDVLATITDRRGPSPMPADVEATWASLNLGIDTGR